MDDSFDPTQPQLRWKSTGIDRTSEPHEQMPITEDLEATSTADALTETIAAVPVIAADEPGVAETAEMTESADEDETADGADKRIISPLALISFAVGMVLIAIGIYMLQPSEALPGTQSVSTAEEGVAQSDAEQSLRGIGTSGTVDDPQSVVSRNEDIPQVTAPQAGQNGSSTQGTRNGPSIVLQSPTATENGTQTPSTSEGTGTSANTGGGVSPSTPSVSPTPTPPTTDGGTGGDGTGTGDTPDTGEGEGSSEDPSTPPADGEGN